MYSSSARSRVVRFARIAWSELLHKPVCSWYARGSLWLQGAEVGRDFVVRGRIRLRLEGRLIVGADVRMNSGPSNFVGGDGRVNIWVGRQGKLVIGDGCAISNSTFCCQSSIRIGHETFIGGGCRLYDTDFHPVDPDARIRAKAQGRSAPIEVAPMCFVGGHCTILKGVRIGEGAIVGAGSVVTRSVPDYEIWAGVPARRIGVVPPGPDGQPNRQSSQAGG